MHVAAFMGHLNIVLLLLQNGACPDATNIVSTAGRSLRVRGAVGEPGRLCRGDRGLPRARREGGSQSWRLPGGGGRCRTCCLSSARLPVAAAVSASGPTVWAERLYPR